MILTLRKMENSPLKSTRQPWHQVILSILSSWILQSGAVWAAKRLRAIDHAAKAVVSSGYSDDAVVSNYRQRVFSAFLKKPYDINSLQDVLN